MRKVISAGGIVIKNVNGVLKILLIKFYTGNGYSFPKGHIEKGEDAAAAALREVSEETGLKDLVIIKKLGMVKRPGVEPDGTVVNKDIYLFLMKTSNYHHYKADEIYRWFTIDEALEKLSVPQEIKFLKLNINNLSSNTFN